MAFALVAATEFFLARTRQGRAIGAWSQDPEAAQLCGVHGYASCFALGAYVTAILTTSDLRFAFIMPRVPSFGIVFVCSLAITALYGALLATLDGSTSINPAS